MRSASPLVIHTTLTRPPAAITRWITPAQHSVSSSGCGDTTSSEVRASRAGSAAASGAGGAALAPTRHEREQRDAQQAPIAWR